MNRGTTLTSSRRRAATGIVALLAIGGLLCVPATASAQTSPQTSAPIGAYTTTHAWSFKSVPTLHPPKLTTDHKTKQQKLANGDFLVASFPNIGKPGPMDGQSGPLILDSKLQPVWFKPLPTDVVVMDLKQDTYDGKPVLTWWQGDISDIGALIDVTTQGRVVIVNEHYKKVATVVGTDGWIISPHDAVISGHDVWVSAYKMIKGVDLSAYGGAKSGMLYDFAVQEYDLQTGKLVYTWDAYKHVPLSATYKAASPKATVPWDPYHGNALELVGNGDLLVSLRNTWAVYLVNIKTGDVIWTLGGKDSDFTVPRTARFAWQHDVKLEHANVLTVFDDDCCEYLPSGTFGPPSGPAKGLVLKLNTAKKTAKLVHQYTRGANFDVAFMGSTQILPNGNVLVGWGSKPYFSEFTKGGKMLLDAVWPGKDVSYRALFTDTWVGKPKSLPDGAARKAHGKDTVYASWNGDTQVSAWRVLAGSTISHLKAVSKKAKDGFETAIHLKRSYKQFKVQALNAKGKVIGTSEAFMVPTPGFY